MTFRKIGFLALIVALFFGYIYQVEIPRDLNEKREGKFLKGLTEDDLRQIDVTYKDGTKDRTSFSLVNKVELSDEEKDQFTLSNWRLKSLPEYPLDSSQVSILTSALETLSLDEPIPESDDDNLKVFGLGNPHVKIQVKAKESAKVKSKDFTINLGKKSDYFATPKRYIQLGSNSRVYFIDEAVFNSVDKVRDDFRISNPIKLDDSDSRTMRITVAGKEPLVFNSDDGIAWKLVSPASLKVEDVQVSEYIRKLQTLNADYFYDGEKELRKFALDEPDVLVEFLKLADVSKDKEAKSSKQDETYKLEVEKIVRSIAISTPETDKELLTYFKATDYDTVFATKGDQVGQFIKEPITFLERAIFNFDAPSVKKLTFSHDGLETELVKDKDNWVLTHSEKGKVLEEKVATEREFVDELLNNITSIQVKGLAATAIKKFRTILKLTVENSDSGNIEFTISGSQKYKKLGNSSLLANTSEEGSGHFVVRSDWDATYWIDESQYEKLIPKVSALKKNVLQKSVEIESKETNPEAKDAKKDN